MVRRKKTAQAMSDEAKIAAARKKLVKLGLDEKEVMPKLLEKYGVLAYDFVNKALQEPGRLCNRTGEKFLPSKKLILHYANDDVSEATLAKAIHKQESEVKLKSALYKAEQTMAQIQSGGIEEIYDEAKENAAKVEKRVDERAESAQPSYTLTRVEAGKTNETSEQGFTLTPVSPDLAKKLELHSAQSNWSTEAEKKEEGSFGMLDPQYDENTPQGQARKKAREKLREMKEKNGGRGISFADLKANGVLQGDISSVITKDRIGEVSGGSKEMNAIATRAVKTDRVMGSNYKCGAAARKTLQDSVRVNIQDHMDPRYKSAYVNKSGRRSNTQYTASSYTDSLSRNSEFVSIEYEYNSSEGNSFLKNITAKGTYVGYEGAINSIQPAGHLAGLGIDGKWHADSVNSEDWLCYRAAQRYCDRKTKTGSVSVIFHKSATVSDKMAEDMLYQKYEREAELEKFNVTYKTQENISR